MAFDLSGNRKAGNGVTGPEIGFSNLMPLSSPITMSNPATSLGRMIRDAITLPEVVQREGAPQKPGAKG